jgi:hypothetical protein
LFFLWRLPGLGTTNELDDLRRLLERQRIEVVVVDSLTECLLAGRPDVSADNVYQMVPIISAAASACLDVGTTPVFVHSTRMSASFRGSRGAPRPHELSYPGIADISKQWLLLGEAQRDCSRPGMFRVPMNVGSNAGLDHHWFLQINAGVLYEGRDERKWQVGIEYYTPDESGRPRKPNR